MSQPANPTPKTKPTTTTTTYNIYKIHISQTSGVDHQAIALVPSQNALQTAGRFYHVVGLVGLGMDYECKPGHNFGDIPQYEKSVFQFRIPRSSLDEFEHVARNTPVPCDPRALMERNPDPPVRDCADWVDEVLGQVRELLEKEGVEI